MRGCPHCGSQVQAAADSCVVCGTPLDGDPRTRAAPPGFDDGPALIGTTLGGYEIEAELGRGGMGVVSRARDVALRRTVAVKVITPALATDRLFRERFRRESRLAAQIEHPAVVPVYRAGQDRGRLFIAMRLIDGTDLGSILRRDGPLPRKSAVEIIGAIAGALDAAHSHGLVHRDIKPGNVLVAGDRAGAYLTDFGLTVDTAATTALTRSGQWVGTVAYAAPEQLRGGRVDARTDVYALAGVLHHCLTGALPYPATRDVDAIAAHLTEPPPKPSSVNRAIPRQFDAVVARGMAKDGGRRYPSAGDLAAAAAAAADSRPSLRRERSVATGSAAPPTAPSPRRARIGRGTVAALVAFVAACAGAALVLAHDDPTPDRGTKTRPPGRPVAVDGAVDAIAVTRGAVWTMAAADGRLTRTDPGTGASSPRRAPANLNAGEFRALAAGAGALWQVQGFDDGGAVTEIDP